MAEERSQRMYWAQPAYNGEHQYSAPLNYYEGAYDVSQLGIIISPEVQYTPTAPLPSQLIDTFSDISPTAWSMSGPEHSPGSGASTPSPNLQFVDPNFPSHEHNQNDRPNDAVEKRRQQNRNSQMAYRQRTKKLIEDLRQEVTEYSEYSQDMYQVLQSLRETTKALVSTIDHALSRQPPMGYKYMERQRTEGLDTRRSSRSSETRQGLQEKRFLDG